MSISVRKKVCEKILKIIEDLQKGFPREPVRQKQVYDKLKKQTFNKLELSPRHVRRAFRKLRKDSKIIRSDRGQYWLPEYLERNIEYLKRRIEFEKSFWETVDDLRSKKIAELERKLLHLERCHEDMLEHHERQEILRELRKKGL